MKKEIFLIQTEHYSKLGLTVHSDRASTMRFSRNFITGWKELLIKFDFDLSVYISVTCMFNV